MWTVTNIKVKTEKATAVQEYTKKETRSKALREFLLSFQLPIIQPMPEIPRN